MHYILNDFEKKKLDEITERKYFVEKGIEYCYPYGIGKNTKNYGVLIHYIGKEYTRDEIDKIICEMIIKHPYISGSMSLGIIISWREDNVEGIYQDLNFENIDYRNQSMGCTTIFYENQ